MGIPLMQTIFDDDDNLGIYVIPLLIYHPLQLVLGSLASQWLKDWADKCPMKLAAQESKAEHATQNGADHVDADADADADATRP
eukprot:SAG31_NODE_15702_length_742_cov_1.152411_1_plen_84_part_00